MGTHSYYRIAYAVGPASGAAAAIPEGGGADGVASTGAGGGAATADAVQGRGHGARTAAIPIEVRRREGLGRYRMGTSELGWGTCEPSGSVIMCFSPLTRLWGNCRCKARMRGP